MTCPFYGKGDPGLGVLMPTHGNQCAVVRIAHSPCRMEIMKRPIEWPTCVLRLGNRETGRCVGCNLLYGDSYSEIQGLCPDCLDRAELLATEAAGQQRLSL